MAMRSSGRPPVRRDAERELRRKIADGLTTRTLLSPAVRGYTGLDAVGHPGLMTTGGERDPRAATGREFLAWLRLGRPVIADGPLPEGQYWTLAYGINDSVPVADLFVEFTAGGGMATGVGRYGAEDGLMVGASTGARSNDRRILCWMTRAEITEVLLDTVEHGELPATLVHTDDEQRVRVFLAVVEDPAVALRATRFRDGGQRSVAVEDLSGSQADFESWLADPRAYLVARGVGPSVSAPEA